MNTFKIVLQSWTVFKVNRAFPSNNHCLVGWLFVFFCFELENDELCFCCLQFGGMFLAPMTLLMELTLPSENVLCLTCVCLTSFHEK
jgi:hypothetical protein